MSTYVGKLEEQYKRFVGNQMIMVWHMADVWEKELQFENYSDEERKIIQRYLTDKKQLAEYSGTKINNSSNE